MTSLLLTLALLAPSAHAAVRRAEQRFRDTHLVCWAATADLGLGVAYFTCESDRARRYQLFLVGVGYGGLFTVSRFDMVAHLERGRELAGHYTGPSTTWALGLGVGAAYFTRNPNQRWMPDFTAEEYIYLYGVHLGVAGDVSMNTVYIREI